MPVVINGTTGITVPDGAAGAPAVRGTTYATNGLFFPSSNTVSATDTVVANNTIIAGNNISPFLGFKNRVINGNMTIDQRYNGVAQNITTAYNYFMDRWCVTTSTTASGTLTVQRIATSTAGETPYCMRLLRSSGTYAAYLIAAHCIENVNCVDLAGDTVTLSFRMRKGSGWQGGNVNAYLYTGTTADEGVTKLIGGTWAGQTATGFTAFTPTTSFQTYSLTATMPTNMAELAVLFSHSNFTGTGSATDYIEITDVQLEQGSVATTIERRPLNSELTLCERYFQITGNGWTGMEETTTTFSMAFTYRSWMRVTPTLTALSSSVSTRIPSISTDRVISSASISSYTASQLGAWVVWSNPGGGNVQGRFIQDRGGANIYSANAELT